MVLKSNIIYHLVSAGHKCDETSMIKKLGHILACCLDSEEFVVAPYDVAGCAVWYSNKFP